MRIDPAGLTSNATRAPATPAPRSTDKLSETSASQTEAGSFLPTSELASLLSAVGSESEIRTELVGNVVERMQNGEFDTPQAALEAARAFLETEAIS